MLNDLFKKYSDQSFEEIEIDSHHKKQLLSHLFKEKEVKRHFWTWTKAIFTAPVVATIAIVFFLSSNQETVKVLLPQEALAQALENTFNLDTFETTFGLPDDGKLYHRVMTYNSNHSENPIEPYVATTNIWTDGTKMRRDSLILSKSNDQYRNFNSFLINPQEDLRCYLELFKECESLSAFNANEIERFTSGKGVYNAIETENLIENLTVEPFYDAPKGPVYLIQWSTKEPMKSAGILNGYDLNGGAGGMIDDPYTVAHPDANSYVNDLKEGKYWHKTSISMDTNFIADKKFFQITNHDSQHLIDPRETESASQNFDPNSKPEYSMIYTIDRNYKVSPFATDAYIQEIKKRNTSTDAAKDMYYMGFQTAIFFLKRDNFSDPVFVKNIKRDGIEMVQLRFILPDAYFRSITPDPITDDYFIDLFIDESQTRFLGYAKIKNEVELESLWIEDGVLPDSQKLKFFDKSAWMESFKEEDKAKEPERQEAQKWIELEKAQTQTQDEF